MPVFHAVILAMVQAATEFLPVSSTAHLILVPWVLGWREHSLLFDISVHLGTLAAVLLYFGKTWVRLIGLAVGSAIWRPAPGDLDHDLYENPRLLWRIVAATIPAGVAGFFVERWVETVLRRPVVIGVMLIVVGLVIAWAEKVGSFDRDLDRMSLRDAMLIGCAQAVALIPGTSRSGATMATAMLLGVTRHSAARFSFLLSAPIILGAGAKAAFDAWSTGGIPQGEQAAFAVGVVTSAIFGYLVIAFLLRYLQRATMRVFVHYRIALGVLVLALVALGKGPG